MYGELAYFVCNLIWLQYKYWLPLVKLFNISLIREYSTSKDDGSNKSYCCNLCIFTVSARYF